MQAQYWSLALALEDNRPLCYDVMLVTDAAMFKPSTRGWLRGLHLRVRELLCCCDICEKICLVGICWFGGRPTFGANAGQFVPIMQEYLWSFISAVQGNVELLRVYRDGWKDGWMDIKS